MFDIQITIDGKKHKKNKPRLKDYVAMVDYNEKYYGKSFINTKDAVLEAVELIESWFNNEITANEIEDNCDLDEIMSVFRQIESNVFEVFIGVPLKTAIQEVRKAQKTTKKGKQSEV